MKLIDLACNEETTFSSPPYPITSPACMMSTSTIDDYMTASCETELTQMFLQNSYGDNFKQLVIIRTSFTYNTVLFHKGFSVCIYVFPILGFLILYLIQFHMLHKYIFMTFYIFRLRVMLVTLPVYYLMNT